MIEMGLSIGTLLSAFFLGFLGSGHCLGMCGGISAALGLQGKGKNLLLSYNLGRIGTYAILGLIAGLVGSSLALLSPLAGPILRTLSGLLLVALGFYLGGWWLGLSYLEKTGSQLWKHIQPITAGLLPAKNNRQALCLGALWGFLPCGLVYSTLSWALANADGSQSALLMACFGLGTLPAMLVTGHAGQLLLGHLRKAWVRTVIALLMIIMGLVTAYIPWQHQGHIHQQHNEPMPESEHHHH